MPYDVLSLDRSRCAEMQDRARFLASLYDQWYDDREGERR